MNNITKSILEQHDPNNTKVFLSIMALFGLPNSLLDIGSGSGIMTATARALGVDAIGLDLLAESPDICHDLSLPITLNRQFDMIISLETAEHIQNAEVFTETIAKHLAPNGILIFSAAIPGQKGNGHINCQNHDYWRNKFYARGIVYSNELTAVLALIWSQTAGGLAAWLVTNLQVFTA